MLESHIGCSINPLTLLTSASLICVYNRDACRGQVGVVKTHQSMVVPIFWTNALHLESFC